MKVLLLILFMLICSCKGISVIPHNLYKAPGERKGMIETPSGMIHKSTLTRGWRDKYIRDEKPQ